MISITIVFPDLCLNIVNTVVNGNHEKEGDGHAEISNHAADLGKGNDLVKRQ